MTYKGGDLDLRLWSGPAAVGVPRAARGAPILVDDLVLACCNHAFEIAAAAPAYEVRLEHLLAAMTRIDAAAARLAARGIDVMRLGIESSALLGDGYPPYAQARFAPRQSELLEYALRSAEAAARFTGGPATIEHLLDTLLSLDPSLPGVDLVRRHTPSTWNLRDPMDQHAARGYAMPTTTDSVQNSRLDILERSVRELLGEISNLRQGEPQPVMAPPLMAPIMPAMVAQQMPQMMPVQQAQPVPQMTVALPHGFSDRLGALERSIDARFGELSRTWALLGDRLQSLEAAMVGVRTDGSVLPAALVERLQGLETTQRRFEDVERLLAGFGDRLAGIERAVSTRPADQTAALSPVIARLTAIEEAVATQPIAPADMAPVVARLNAIDARFADSAKGAHAVAERLGRLEHMMEEGVGDADRSIGHVVERVRALQEGVEAQSVALRQLSATLAGSAGGGEQMRTLIADRIGGLAQPMLERLAGVGQLVETRHAEGAAMLGQLAERMVHIDRRLGSDAQVRVDTEAQHRRELAEIHEALVKLNANQQTIANSIDQWRLDNTGDLGQLANKIDSIERSGAKRALMLEGLGANLAALQTVSVRREENKSRFRHWLMGTDDWYGASWESQAIEAPRASGSGNGTHRGPPPVPRPVASAGERR